MKKKNWRTSLFGALTLGLTGLAIYAKPETAANPEIIAALTAGVGLLVAGDAQNTSSEPPPEIPPGPDVQ